MPLTIPRTVLLTVLFLAEMACSHPVLQRDGAPPAVPPAADSSGDRHILAGEWEYEDGAVVALKLDEAGNGSYAWKDGRFETTGLNGHTWLGRWIQKENDREGGFRVELSRDFSEGDGFWWYTRIGEDRAPAQKGGTFRLTRRAEGTAYRDAPLPPDARADVGIRQ